jgi:hypothetical protein
MTEFISRLKLEIESIKKSDVTTIQKHFQFYIMEIVSEAILSCIESHKPLIQQLLQSIAKDFSANNLFDEAKNNDFKLSVNIADISWTAVDSVSFFLDEGLLLMGINSPVAGISQTYIGIIGQAVAGFIRQNRMKDKQVDLLTPVLENFSSIESIVYEQVENAYAKMSEKACEKLTKLFESELENSQNAINQAIEISENKGLQTENMKMQIANAFSILDNIDSIISKFE